MGAVSTEALANIKLRTVDMFGKLPEEVETLFLKREIDLLVETADVKKVDEYDRYLELELGSSYINIRGIGNILFESLIPYLSIIKLSYAKNIFKIRINKKEKWIVTLKNLLNTLNEIVNKR